MALLRWNNGWFVFTWSNLFSCLSLYYDKIVNSLSPRGCGFDFKSVILKCIAVITRAEMMWPAHDMIWFTIQCTWYDTFHDTFAILARKQRPVILACNQKRHMPPTTAAFTVKMCSGSNNGATPPHLHPTPSPPTTLPPPPPPPPPPPRVSRHTVFVLNSLILLECTGWYLWYLVLVSNFGMS